MRPLPQADLAEIVARLAPHWSVDPNASILITGATGFFGRWLLESLLMLKAELGGSGTIIAQSRDPARFVADHPWLAKSEHLDWWQAHPLAWDEVDLCETIRRRGRAVELQWVIHLVTEGDNRAAESNPAGARDLIVDSARRAAELARALGAGKLLFTSSGSVYRTSSGEGTARRETDPVWARPTGDSTAYQVTGFAKVEAERAVMAALEGGATAGTIARCFSFLGPGLPMAGKFAAGNFLSDALAGRELVITGSGRPIRSYLHPVDLVVGLVAIMARGSSDATYNLGSEQPLSLAQLAQVIADRAPGRPAVRVLGGPDAGGVGGHYVPSMARARAEVDFAETIDVASGVGRTLAWLRDGLRS
jgi:dTDP-glucose 4,6-dehydratase